MINLCRRAACIVLEFVAFSSPGEEFVLDVMFRDCFLVLRTFATDALLVSLISCTKSYTDSTVVVRRQACIAYLELTYVSFVGLVPSEKQIERRLSAKCVCPSPLRTAIRNANGNVVLRHASTD